MINFNPKFRKKVTLHTESENKIEYLGFKGCHLTQEQVGIMINSLKDLSSLKFFDITESEVTVEQAQEILEEKGLKDIKVIKYS